MRAGGWWLPAVMALVPVTGCAASGHDFDAVVSAVQARYPAQVQRVPLMGLVSLCARVVTGDGVKGMQVAEFENFRKVRDIEGTEGWVHMNLLSSRRDVVVTGAVRTLRREPRDDAPAVARAEPDVIGQILECKETWCRVDVNGFRGWLKRTEFWGLLPNEKIE